MKTTTTMTRRTVYVIKELTWHYNDECTIPHSADVIKAYARRDEAERQRFIMELGANYRPEEDAFGRPPQPADGSSPETYLQRFDVLLPPVVDDDYRAWNSPEWHQQVLAQLGPERYDEFRQAFSARTYYYHVVETELEV